MKKTLLISSSLSSKSINYELLIYVKQFIPEGHVSELVSIRNYVLPLYNIDIEKEPGIAENGLKFMQLIEKADKLIFGIAEHNGSVTAGFKNLMDWLSRLNNDYRFLSNKEVLLLGTSPSSKGAVDAIGHSGFLIRALGGKVMGQLAFPNYYSTFSSTENGLLLNNEELKDNLLITLGEFFSGEKNLPELEEVSGTNL